MPQHEQGLVERVSAMLLGELTQGGKRDLGAMRLDDLEGEVFGLADARKCATSVGGRRSNRASGGIGGES